MEGDKQDLDNLIKKLELKNQELEIKEQELADQSEELVSQKEELTAAIEELMAKNQTLNQALTKLSDRNFELDQILYRTSHDLRTPVASIQGILHLLSLEPQSDTIKEYRIHLEAKTEQMNNLLNSLSSLSKVLLEEPIFTTLSLDEMVTQVTNEFQALPVFSSTSIVKNLELLNIKSDPLLIKILLQSLVSNAFTFRNPEKEGKIIIHSTAKDDRLEIEVMDDGEGISPRIRSHIFDMFYRGSDRSRGSGLGLYVAKNAAQRLNGTIHASLETSLTRFVINLPLLD